MTVDIEDRLRTDAARVVRRLAEVPLPPEPHRRAHRPVVVLAGVAIACVVVVALVIAVDGDRDTITTIDTVSPTTAPASTAGSGPSTSDLASSSPSSAPSSSPGDEPVHGRALGTVGPGGSPAALSTVPDGYRVVLTSDTPSGQSSAGGGWAATFVRRPAPGGAVAPYLQVQIDPVSDSDPYEGFPGLADTPDVTMGAFTGKLWELAPGYRSLVSLLPDGRRLIAGGRAERADVEMFVAGVRLRTDGVGADATALPDGFEPAGEGPTSGTTSTTEWAVSYASGQLMSSMITVRARVDPAAPALQRLLMPSETSVVDVNGVQGVLTTPPWTVTFDVTPTYQIEVSTEDGSPFGPDEVVALARSVVAVTPEDFARLSDEAAAHPLAPTDMQCSHYVGASDVRADEQLDATDGEVELVAPGEFTMLLSARQAVRDVVITVGSIDGGWQQRQLLRLDDLTEPTTMTVQWDGTFDGEPAPTGRYGVSVSAAAPLEPAAGSCTAGNGSLDVGVTFVVQ